MSSFGRVGQCDVDITVVGGEVASDYNCVFSFDTKFLYCPSGHVIKVYNVATGRFCGQLEGHKDRITTLIMNERNHLQLISGGLDGVIVVWDIGTEYSAIKVLTLGRPIHKVGLLKCFTNSYLVVLQDNSNGRFFVADSGAVVSGNVQNAPVLFELGHVDTKSVSFGFETNVIAAIESQRKLIVWSADLSRIVSIGAPTFQMSFTGIAAHPTDRNVVAASTNGGRIYLWIKVFTANDNTAAVPSFYLHWHSNSLRSLAFSPEGTFLFSGGEECVFVKWLWRKQQRTFVPRLGAPVRSMALSPDGAIYALGLTDNTIAVISSNMTMVRSIRSFITGTNIPAVRPQLTTSDSSLSPLGLLVDQHLHVLVTNSRPGHLQFFDADACRNLLLLDVTAENYVSGGPKLLPITEVLKADISTDGCWLGTVQSRGDVETECTLKIWQWEEKLKTFCINTLSSRAHLGMVTAVKFSPTSSPKDDRTGFPALLTASLDGFFRIWHCYKQEPSECTALQSVYRWQNTFASSYHSCPIYDTDWSADGSLAALAAGAYILLVDGNTGGDVLYDGGKCDVVMRSADSVDDHWLLSSLTIDTTSRIVGLKFGQQEDSSFIVGCSSDGEGSVCVWNLATLQLTWKTTLLLPLLVSNPLSSYMTVLSGAAMEQKKMLHFKPSMPATADSLDFVLPSACSDTLASQISPIISAVFMSKRHKSDLDNAAPSDSVFSHSNLYLLTRDQKLYVISSSSPPEQRNSAETDAENVKDMFRFSSLSIVSSGNFPQSSLASLLALGSSSGKTIVNVRESVPLSLASFDPKTVVKFDPLFETPPHLLPPVSRISSEFLLRRCTEICGVVGFSRENREKPKAEPPANSGDAARAKSSSLIDQKAVVRSDIDWVREVM